MSVILASRSPRRRELLQLIELDFTAVSADADETLDTRLSPKEAVAEISRRKADAAAAFADCQDIIIAADTVVVLDGTVFGKPKSEADALRILKMLSGRTHQVMTGVTIRRGEQILTATEVTDITFRTLSEDEIKAYIMTGEPMDKAGAYGIQGKASVFVSGIKGDYYNVVGLPLCRLTEMLKLFGVEVFKKHC